MKTLTLKLKGYTVKGIADLTLWGGGNGCIEMKPFFIGQKSIVNDDKLLLENCNDNGFGVQSINGAICDIFENYEGTLNFLETIEVGEISEHTRNSIY